MSSVSCAGAFVSLFDLCAVSHAPTHLPPTAPQHSPACDTHAENTNEFPAYRSQPTIVHFSVGCAKLRYVNLN